MDGRKNNKGTKGNRGGRKPKRDEQKLIERLSPMADAAYNALEKAINKGEPWAIKMWMEYSHGKPIQKTETKMELQGKNFPDWMDG